MIKQSLYLDINKGDILLGGRFKNVRTEVKKLGTDKLGQPTYNGKKLLAVRIEKTMPKNKRSSVTQAEMKKESGMDLNKIREDAFNDELNKIAEGSMNTLKTETSTSKATSSKKTSFRGAGATITKTKSGTYKPWEKATSTGGRGYGMVR